MQQRDNPRVEAREIISAAWREYIATFKGGPFSGIVQTWGKLRFHEVARETLSGFEETHHRLPTVDELLYAISNRGHPAPR